MRIVFVVACAVLVGALGTALPLREQGPVAQAKSPRADDPAPARRHTAVQRREVRLVAPTLSPPADNTVTIRVEGEHRLIHSDVPRTADTGTFPDMSTPRSMRPTSVDVSLPIKPVRADEPTHFDLGIFGIALNGVIFEPQVAEWYLGMPGSEWQYEPLGGAVALGLDTQYAHVQRSDTHHHKGVPDGLMKRLGVRTNAASPIVGWALDGFPIYALFADVDGTVQEMRSGYVVKSGARPAGGNNPGGTYDGTFTADYKWTGAGDLDECNGAFVKTSDFPDGTYAYFLTRSYPVIPRCFAGTPVAEYRP